MFINDLSSLVQIVMPEKTVESPLDCLPGDQTSKSEKKSTVNIHWKDWYWSWSSNNLATWWGELTHWKRPWCWARLGAGEGDDRGWDGWMASMTKCRMWIWVNCRRCWSAREPGILQSMGSHRVRHEIAIEQQQSRLVDIPSMPCPHQCFCQ